MPRPKHGVTDAGTSARNADGTVGKGRRLGVELAKLIAEMAPGDLFPSDRVIAERYGLARMTVRGQVDALVKQGLLERVPGRGTFVTAPGGVRADVLPDFSSEMRSRGLTPGSIILSLRIAKATRADRRSLRLTDNEPVIRLTRIRLTDGSPVGVERARLPGHRFSGLCRADLESASLYDVLASKYGVVPERAAQTIAVISAQGKDAEHLDVRTGTPVLEIERVTKDTMGRPVETRVSVFRPDRYHVRMQLGFTSA